MCFRPSVVFIFFLFSQRMRPCHNQLQREKAGKTLDLSAPRLEAIAWAAVYLKCFPVPNATHSSYTFISSTTEIASTTTSVSAIRIIIFFCSIKKYSCVGLFVGASTHMVLWMMRPRCHRKWRRVFCEKLEFFQFFWKESKTVTLVLIVLLEGGR